MLVLSISNRIQKFLSNHIFRLYKLSLQLNIWFVSSFGGFSNFQLVSNALHLRFVSDVFCMPHSIFCYFFSS